MRKITNAKASHVMCNPFRSIPLKNLLPLMPLNSVLPCLMLYFGDRSPIKTNISVKDYNGDLFGKYDVYEEDGKIYVKVGDNIADSEITLDIIAPFNYDLKYEE